MAELFTIDIHTHILPENIPTSGEGTGTVDSSTWTTTSRVVRG
jgi:hypothetical protein